MLRKSLLVILLAACTAISACPAISAQEPQSNPSGDNAADPSTQAVRQDIRAHRKQITADNMVLSSDEAAKFWPIYDQYIQETVGINDARWSLMKDYSANFEKMTDELAADYMKRSAAIDQQLVALREKYVPMLEKVISVQKTARWYQVDRRLDLMINLQLSAMVPMVDLSKPASQ
jgi:hypothetical protein